MTAEDCNDIIKATLTAICGLGLAVGVIFVLFASYQLIGLLGPALIITGAAYELNRRSNPAPKPEPEPAKDRR
jgi:hypothetical protein